LRDATFRVVPKSLFKSIENECRKIIAGDTKSFDQRRAAVVQWINRLGIVPERVWAALGIQGPDEITPEHLLTLTGLRTSIKDKETTPDEAFPAIGANAAASTGAIGRVEKPDTGETKKAEESAKTGAVEKPEPAKPSGPSAVELIKQLLKKGAEINLSRSLLTAKLIELGLLQEGQNLADLDAKAAGLALDAWPQIKESVVK
jgi:hypothetical protein